MNLIGIFVLIIVSEVNSKSVLEAKVIDGEFARIVHHPHSVYLHIECSEEQFICGASIINQRIVLSAGHCFEFKKCPLETVKVNAYAGHHDFRQMKVIRNVTEIIRHGKFRMSTVEHDIALLRLSEDLPLGRTMRRVVIPSVFPHYRYATVAGWGIVNVEQGESSYVLISLMQKLRSKDTCERLALEPGTFCAGSAYGTDPRPVHGDSGAALIGGGVEQLGLLSYRRKRFPALVVYTNVTYYYKWINRNARRIYCLTDDRNDNDGSD